MKKEHVLVFIIGLLILTYVLDRVAEPLALALSTPYHYFNPQTIYNYAFSSTSIALKAIALVLAPPLILSTLGVNNMAKGLSLVVLSGLMQLYSLQAILTHSKLLPLEWSLSLTLSGMILLIPAILYIILGFTQNVAKKLADPYASDSDNDDEDEEKKSSED